MQLKKKKSLYIGIIYGKQESRSPIKTLDNEFQNIEQTIYQYIPKTKKLY